MANEKHVAQLKKGLAAWNAWRDQNPDIVPDLGGANLSEADLNRVNLAGANLSQANLIMANLIMANLSKANLLEADLSHANLSIAHRGVRTYVYRYEGLGPLLATLAEKVIVPAEAKVQTLAERRRMIEAELTKPQ
jgi:hypothetical protein